MEERAVKCAQCGYDLTGVAVGESLGQCPECGATFDPERPLPIRPWPPPWKMAFPLCGGLLILVGVDAAGLVANKAGWGEAASILSTLISMAWAPAFLGGPILGAWWLSRRHAHP